MGKFLVEANYTSEGLRGLQKDKAAGRQAALNQAVQAVGGSVESFHFALGKADVFVILDLPDAVTAAALGAAVSATGLVRTSVTTLLTVAEMDEALAKGASYRGPGQ